VDKPVEVLVGVAAAALVAVAAVAVYRWGRRRRALRVEAPAKKFLSDWDGELPRNGTVNCSGDALRAVLVACDHPRTGARHRLQFGVREPDTSLSLVWEQVDNP
jgi:hypothetical protein